MTTISKPMKEVSVEEILQNYNLIVPEIQREYVWGYNEHGILETFINDIKEGYETEGELSPEVVPLQQLISSPAIDEETRKSLVQLLEKSRKSTPSINIGFLYSYKPSYYIGNDREEDLYLIDGQQRFTTLFLILYYFSLKESRKNDFISMFKFNAEKEKIAFDYRVRSITHQFVIELIDRSKVVEDLLDIKNKQWFLSNYSQDVTIKSIIGVDENTGVFKMLHDVFSADRNKYFDFIRNDIKFWHFKTEETSQGEELYITMNSRGQQLADNENIRAKLFDSDEVKNNALKSSENWELWQDYFWKSRNRTDTSFTADEGFNEFLRWVQILKMFDHLKNDSTNDSSKYETELMKVVRWDTETKLNVHFLNLDDIELTFDALQFLYGEFKKTIEDEIATKYSRYKQFDLLENKWISHENGAVDQIDLFQLLPLLLICKKNIKEGGTIDKHILFRHLRAFHVLSKDETIGKSVRNQIINVLYFADSFGPNEDVTSILDKQNISKTVLNNELRAKLTLYRSAANRLQMEDLFWCAENLDPSNHCEITHLINLTNSISKVEGEFDLKSFEILTNAYRELLEAEDLIWGNLIYTDVYKDQIDRVEFENYWHKKSGFMSMVTNRTKTKESLDDFILKMQKQFVGEYKTLDEMKKEDNAQKQLYLYYIISTNDVLKKKPHWDWHGNFNFGKFESFKGCRSLFEDGTIFQVYNSAFRENENKVLSIHTIKQNDALGELLAWSND